MKDTVQVLPIIYNQTGKLYILNVTNVVDCLDYDNSDVTYFDSGRVSDVRKFSFHEHLVINQHIFKIPELLRGYIFVSDTFKAAVEKHDLKGFEFIEVWNSNREEVEARQRRYEYFLKQVQEREGPEYTFDDACLQLDKGFAFVSGKWKIQNDQKGQFVIGELTEEGDYKFYSSIYYPPILIGMKWKKTEPSDI